MAEQIPFRIRLRELTKIVRYEERVGNLHAAEHIRNQYLNPMRRVRGMRGHQRPRHRVS